MKKLLIGTTLILSISGIVGLNVIAKDQIDSKESYDAIKVISERNEEEFRKKVESLPTGTPLPADLATELKKIQESQENNQEPPLNKELKNDSTVTKAINYIVETDKQISKKILMRMPYGELVHFNTFEKGYYPEELLEEAVETQAPILWSLKELSENEELDTIIMETENKMREAVENGDAYEYLKAWEKLDFIKETVSNQLYEGMW